MANNTDLNALLAVFQLLSQTGDIKVPTEFHARCAAVAKMLDSDTTGIIQTVTNYAIGAASEVKYKIKTTDAVEKILNDWLKNINSSFNKIPTGIRALSQEYFRERWQGSSLCGLIVHFPSIDSVKKGEIILPDYMYFLDGSSVYIQDGDEEVVTLGEYKYYLGKPKDKDENLIDSDEDQKLLFTKPFDRWHKKYPSPYLVRTGNLRNFLGFETLQTKGDDVIKRVLPYIVMLLKGDAAQVQKGLALDDTKMSELQNRFSAYLKNYQTNNDEVPLYTATYDTQFQHIIPDMSNILKRDLFTQRERAILYGLGFVEVIMGSSRQETILNPKPFIQEVVNGVEDFRSLMMDVIRIIVEKNKEGHRKYFSDSNTLEIGRTPIKIDVAQILDGLRLGYIYGASSRTTYQESLGLDPTHEKELRKTESEGGDDELFYPPIIQNVEEKGIDIPMTKKQTEKQTEKNQMKANEETIMAPYSKPSDLPPAVKDNMDEDLQRVFVTVFNRALKTYKNESRAFRVAWSVIKKIAKKDEDDKWHKISASKDKYVDKVIAKLDEIFRLSEDENLDNLLTSE